MRCVRRHFVFAGYGRTDGRTGPQGLTDGRTDGRDIRDSRTDGMDMASASFRGSLGWFLGGSLGEGRTGWTWLQLHSEDLWDGFHSEDLWDGFWEDLWEMDGRDGHGFSFIQRISVMVSGRVSGRGKVWGLTDGWTDGRDTVSLKGSRPGPRPHSRPPTADTTDRRPPLTAS